jgi:hypothetical protein
VSTSIQVPRISGEPSRETRSPILVTGAPRSGTTFLGTMLSLNRSVSYIYEPMSRTHGLRDIPSPLLYVRNGSRNEEVARRMTREMLAGRGSFRRPPPAATGLSSPTEIARRMIGSRVSLRYRTQVLNPMRRRWLLKDPWAAFASEWLHREIGTRTVVIVRHPVPTVLSYRRLGWDFQVDELTTMDELMTDHLTQMLDGIDLAALSGVESAALVWRIYYYVLGRYIDRNPDMIVLRHEDLCADPMNVLESLYDKLDLRFDARVRKQVAAYTGQGNLVDGTAGQLHQLQRDSAAVATTWHGKVDPLELATIRTWTEPESARWYGEDDW